MIFSKIIGVKPQKAPQQQSIRISDGKGSNKVIRKQISTTTTMGEVKKMYFEARGQTPDSSTKFFFEGKVLKNEDTASSLEMDIDTCEHIQVVPKYNGG